MWHDIHIGDTTTRYGVFEIITPVQLLMDWAEREYRPWFVANVLPSVLGPCIGSPK